MLADTLILRDVRALSNFRRKPDASDASGVECRSARPEELHSVLSTVLGAAGAPAEHRQVIEFIEFSAKRGIDVRDLVVAAVDDRPAWAILPVRSPGRSMLLLTPPRRPEGIDLGPLIEQVCQRFASSGVDLAQVLLDPPDQAARDLYAAHQFREMAELLYLHAPVRRTAPPPKLSGGQAWETYSPESHAGFSAAILESYQNSLDCPALNGMRHIDDIIAGHKASGEFDPQFWFLLRDGPAARAVLLLSRVPRSDTAELVYLGLVPSARGRGLGDLCMRQALWAVRQMNLSRLSLAVDSRNVPAINLYHRHGFARLGARVAMMRDLRGMLNAQ